MRICVKAILLFSLLIFANVVLGVFNPHHLTVTQAA
jgi:hypothetical protein